MAVVLCQGLGKLRRGAVGRVCSMNLPESACTLAGGERHSLRVSFPKRDQILPSAENGGAMAPHEAPSWEENRAQAGAPFASETLHEAIQGTLVFALANAGALVKLLFTACQCDVQFRQSLVRHEEHERHDGEAWRCRVVLQVAYLLFVEQQLAVAACSMVVVGTLRILRDIHVLDPHLSVVDEAESVYERGLSLADALDFRARQRDACGVGVDDFVVEGGASVLDAYALRFVFSAFLFGHSFSKSL